MAKKNRYYVRKDGLHESIRTINGKRVAFRGKTDREVDRKILEYKEKQERGRTVKQVLDEWQKLKEKSISENTRQTYKMPVKIILQYIGEKPIKDIKPLDVDRIVERMKGQGYSGSSVEMMLTVAKQVFSYAVIQGDIDINPAREITKPRNMPKQKRGILTPEQIQAVTEYRGENYLLGIALLYTGCRRGELLALRYEDVDRKTKRITICRKVSYATERPVIEDHTKTAAGMRTIPLLQPLDDVLPRDRLGLIFHGPDGGPIAKSTFSSAWDRYQDALHLVGPQGQKITPHWFRHTFATICYDAGVDVKSAASMLGHANDSITMQIYTHLTKDREQISAEKLAAYLDKDKSKKEAASE